MSTVPGPSPRKADARRIAIVGVGKIARDQHIPTIATGEAFTLVAAASRNARVGDAECFTSLEALLAARPDVGCVSLCTPPQVRYGDARRALEAGRHVMLEKPPGATLAEVQDLSALAKAQGVTLFATWHSRHAAAVEAAKDWLAARDVRGVEITWKEDVRRWHPGQEWIWEPGAMGVFDPGINALSILTAIHPRRLHLASADLYFPENRGTPIAADLAFHDPAGHSATAAFDWRQEGDQTWTIRFDTDGGEALLSDGGARFTAGGETVFAGPDHEYAGLYARFAELIAAGASEVDLSPMIHVADAFTLGRRIVVDPFHF